MVERMLAHKRQGLTAFAQEFDIATDAKRNTTQKPERNTQPEPVRV